jgi:hypothetical protein
LHCVVLFVVRKIILKTSEPIELFGPTSRVLSFNMFMIECGYEMQDVCPLL